MKQIGARTETIREIFSRQQLAIDLYQRDYTWTRAHLAKLMEDLAAAFERARDARRRGVEPSPYFIGPIILQSKEDAPFLVDGQQRVTTLLLLLIRLARELNGRPPGREIENLIEGEGPGTFILGVPEYALALSAIRSDGYFETSDATDAERALADRYVELDELFPEEADGPSIAAFARWLLDHVVAVIIEAHEGAVAYQMFETMNNRGQPLRPADLFKHYLLARIPDEEERQTANENWRQESAELQRLGPGEDLAALRTVLLARYGVDQGAVEAGGAGALHAWSPEDAIDTALGGQVDFAKFLGQDLIFYARWYRRFRQAMTHYTDGLEPLFFAARTGVPHLNKLLLAPLDPAEDEATSQAKARVTAAFIDILCARLAWNPKVRRRKKLQQDILETIIGAREHDPERLALFYGTQLARMAPAFAENPTFGLNDARRTDIHSILARLTAYVTFQTRKEDIYPALEVRSGSKAYDVESLLSPAEQQVHDAGQAMTGSTDDAKLLAGLILAPKPTLRDMRSKALSAKLDVLKENEPLFACLSRDARMPRQFRKLNSSLSTAFEPLTLDLTGAFSRRQASLLELSERVWDPARLIAATKKAGPFGR